MKRIATLFAVVLSLGTGALQAQKSTDANAFQAEIQRLEAQRNAGQLSDEQFDRQILKLKKHYAQAQPAAAPVQRAENGAPATSPLVEKRTLVGLYESGKLSEAEFRRAVATLRREGAETAAPQK
jgi:hypothetical protein